MKLNFTRKTWYFFLLASAAVSMLNGFFVLAGQTFGLLEQIAFCLAAIAALFLAAEKLCFVYYLKDTLCRSEGTLKLGDNA